MKLKAPFNFIGIIILFFSVPSVYADAVLTCYRDFDGDGYGNPAQPLSYSVTIPVGYVLNADDCDDTNPLVYPGAPEVCYDGVDNNCNGDLIDGCTQFTTQLMAYYCNSVLASMSEPIRASSLSVNNLPNQVFINAYRFKIKNLSTNQTEIIQKSNYLMQLFETSIAMYNCSFLIEVSIQLNNEWMPYGSGCIIYTPPVPNTVMDVMSCNQQVQNMNSIIRAKTIPIGSRYHFEVSLIENGVAVETTNLIKVGASFNLLLLENISLKFSAEYSVRVKAEGITPDGLVWSTNFGPPCSVFSPHPPEVFVQGCEEEDGLKPLSMSTVIYVNPIGGVNNYRYTLSHENGYSQTFTSLQRTFRLSNFNQLQSLIPGEVYSLAVETMIYGFYYYGKDCNIKVPGGNVLKQDLSMPELSDGKYLIYPNPSDSFFTIQTNFQNNKQIIKKFSIEAYDNFGRMIEKKEVENGERLIYFGENLSSGVYYLKINDGNRTWLDKVVKR